MEKHFLQLHFDGLRAEAGGVLPSASKQVISGAQILLGANAYYYTRGTVPDRVLDKCPEFEILDCGRRKGSWIAEFVINLAADCTWDMMRLGFELFFVHSVVSWWDRRLIDEPLYERREPFLEIPGRFNRPTFDDAPERLLQRERLYHRNGAAFAQVTSPVGTSASKVSLVWNGKQLLEIDERLRWDREISEALAGLFPQVQPNALPH